MNKITIVGGCTFLTLTALTGCGSVQTTIPTRFPSIEETPPGAASYQPLPGDALIVVQSRTFLGSEMLVCRNDLTGMTYRRKEGLRFSAITNPKLPGLVATLTQDDGVLVADCSAEKPVALKWNETTMSSESAGEIARSLCKNYGDFGPRCQAAVQWVNDHRMPLGVRASFGFVEMHVSSIREADMIPPGSPTSTTALQAALLKLTKD